MRHANIGIFVPNNGCPNQCSFCDQHRVTGQAYQPTRQDVLDAVAVAKENLKENTAYAEIAFFGGSFTAIDRGYMVSLLEAAYPFVRDGTFSGIRVSTRPDAVEDEVLGVLKKYGVTAVELGAQSMDDRVLALNRRGHTARCVEEASRRVKNYGFSLGLQMMTGLYGDTPEGSMETAKRLLALQPDTVRVYPTIILKDTELERLYRSGEYAPMGLEESVSLCADILDFFEDRGVCVIRLGLHSTPELESGIVAGPWHPAFRELCESRRILKRLLKSLEEQKIPKGEIEITVSPRCVSPTVGQKKRNLAALAELGYLAQVKGDAKLSCEEFTIKQVNKCS